MHQELWNRTDQKIANREDRDDYVDNPTRAVDKIYSLLGSEVLNSGLSTPTAVATNSKPELPKNTAGPIVA